MRPQDALLLAVVLMLGLCAPVGGGKPSPCQCSRLKVSNRKNCGFPHISSNQCFKKGCCFNSSIAGVPWCFYPLPIQVTQQCLPEPGSEQCVMEVSDRKDCGFPGITPKDCISRQCCFNNAVPRVPWCFFPKPVEGAKSSSMRKGVRSIRPRAQGPGLPCSRALLELILHHDPLGLGYVGSGQVGDPPE
ncbi:Trefoil factor 2 [Heterocephalus glaber]|uniref:Trefoil factor 2 n=1 Tax=Heterocephalus glaber TaxID=10181 RepID=G5B2T7_HETGA|nr:Trefoil factor 2 [Heterocephalus glaber]